MRFFKGALGLIVGLALGACTTLPAIHNTKGMQQEALAEIRTDYRYFSSAYVVAVYDENRQRVVGTDSWISQDQWDELYLQPGAYRLVVRCNEMGGVAYPAIDVRVVGGRKYFVACRPAAEKMKWMAVIDDVTDRPAAK